MMLLTKENLKNLPRLYSQEHVTDPVVWVKFFTPWTSWTWYATEYDPKQKLFFGWVCGLEKELGYFSLRELESVRGPAGLRIERDRYFTPMRLSEVKCRHAQYGAANPKYPRSAQGYRRVLRIEGDGSSRHLAKELPHYIQKYGEQNVLVLSGPGDRWYSIPWYNIMVKIEALKKYGQLSPHGGFYPFRSAANPLRRADLPPVYATPSNIEKWAQPGLVMYSPRTRETIEPDITDIAGVPRGSKFLDRTGLPMVLALKFSKRSLIALNPQMAANPRPHTEVRMARIPKCDFCSKPAQYDFRTFRGPWAYGCLEHYRMNRAYPELGLGYGQKLIAAGAAK